jgi:hypothetical protein
MSDIDYVHHAKPEGPLCGASPKRFGLSTTRHMHNVTCPDCQRAIIEASGTNPELANLRAEVARLQAAIRLHRDQRGDDRCWMDDEALYAVLPEGYTPPERDTAVELERCRQYIECRRNPRTVYISPQREIERLQALNEELMAREAKP